MCPLRGCLPALPFSSRLPLAGGNPCAWRVAAPGRSWAGAPMIWMSRRWNAKVRALDWVGPAGRLAGKAMQVRRGENHRLPGSGRVAWSSGWLACGLANGRSGWLERRLSGGRDGRCGAAPRCSGCQEAKMPSSRIGLGGAGLAGWLKRQRNSSRTEAQQALARARDWGKVDGWKHTWTLACVPLHLSSCRYRGGLMSRLTTNAKHVRPTPAPGRAVKAAPGRAAQAAPGRNRRAGAPMLWMLGC